MFVETVARDLGSGPQSQSQEYSTNDLLSEESLTWCEIGSGLENRKRE